ncbi:hypothetical protein ACKKBF_B33495 [Auxenochlorella protothecoides x Auxenochlorella symbiontica]
MAQAVSLEAKELSSIDFLKQRPRNERLDLWPFVCAYVAWSGYVLWRLVTIGTEGFYLIQLATYALLAIHAVTFLSGVWSVGSQARLRFRPAGSISQATHVLVVPHAFVGTRDIVPLEQKADAAGVPRYAFSFRKLRFVHSADTGAFTKLKYPSHDTVGAYLAATGLGSEAATSAALERWGDNRFEVPVPSFAALLADQLMAPFFCFQVFCVGLWALDEYWYYSLFTLFMLVTFECTVVVQRLKNLNDVRALQTPKEALNVYRGGKWAKIPGDSLLPGDVVSMLRDDSGNDLVVQADMLLLAGSCIVDEAVLTGESTPQWKSAIDENDEGGAEARLSIKRDKAHVLFGGTKVLQTTGERAARLKTPDNGCLAVVLRTGFGTAQGRLMRTILYSTEKVSANNVETFLFIAFLLVWAIAASGYVLYYGLADPNRDRFKLVLNCIMILTSVVPPELPMELTIAVNASLLALSRLRIFCTEPFRIPLAGKVTTCCFDKTGTLTSDHFVLEGVVGCGAPEGGPEPEAGALQDAKSLPRATARVLAACQSLVQVDKETIGDPLEKVALEAVGWTTLGQLGVRSKDGGPRETVEIVHRYAFSSTLKRMSTLVAVEPEGATATKSHWVLTKGAPEVIRGDLAAVPPQYDATHRPHARVFSAYTLVSLLGQFAVHISFLMFMQRTAHAMMPREERQEPDSEFKPNLINTICFLVNFSIQTMTFAVNYVGAPFNTPLQENRFFALSVNWSTLAYVLLVLDLPRGLRTWFSLVAIPAEMQGQLLVLGGLAYLAAGTIERMARALFPAPLVPEKGGLHRSRTPMGPRKKQQ